jgi:hypothetical protein
MLFPHEERVLAERNELQTKYSALCAFLGSNALNSVQQYERLLLMKQGVAMAEYLDILNERVELHAAWSVKRDSALKA